MSVGGQIVLQPNQSLPSWQKLTTDTDIRTLTTLISPLTTTRERFTKKNREWDILTVLIETF